MKEVILNCPCCNSPAVIEDGYSGLTKMITCTKCGVKCGASFNEREVIDMWNRRDWYANSKSEESK